MKNLRELCVFIQCWRAIAYSGAAPGKPACCLWSRVFCDAAEAVLSMGGYVTLCTRGRGHCCFQTNGRRDVINVNSGICFFRFSSSLLSLDTWDEVSVCTGAWVAGGQFGFYPVSSLGLKSKKGRFGCVLEGCMVLAVTHNVLVWGWPYRKNKQSASP